MQSVDLSLTTSLAVAASAVVLLVSHQVHDCVRGARFPPGMKVSMSDRVAASAIVVLVSHQVQYMCQRCSFPTRYGKCMGDRVAASAIVVLVSHQVWKVYGLLRAGSAVVRARFPPSKLLRCFSEKFDFLRPSISERVVGGNPTPNIRADRKPCIDTTGHDYHTVHIYPELY